MTRKKKQIHIRPSCQYPCQWDDLIDSSRKVVATIYTFEEAVKDDLKPGITKGEDDIYDIVVYAKEINNEVVKKALKDLEEVTGETYVFKGFAMPEDAIILFAEKLMKPLKKYGSQEKGYDFTKALTAKQKAWVISIWIGEILYDAMTYKDINSVKSLTDTIEMEIADLIKQ